MPSPFVHGLDFNHFTTVLEGPTAMAFVPGGQNQGSVANHDLPQRRADDCCQPHRVADPVHRGVIALDHHLDRPFPQGHKKLHAASRQTTVSTCAVWGKRSHE